MKEIFFSANGRKTYGEAFYDIENLSKSIVEMFTDANAFVLSGCEITYSVPSLTVASGYIYLSGRVRYFSGGSVGATSGYLIAKDTDYTADYADGLIKKGGTDYSAQLLTTQPIPPDFKDKISVSMGISPAKISDAWLANYVLEKNPRSGTQTVVGTVNVDEIIASSIRSTYANLTHLITENITVHNKISFEEGRINEVASSGGDISLTDPAQVISGKALGEYVEPVIETTVLLGGWRTIADGTTISISRNFIGDIAIEMGGAGLKLIDIGSSVPDDKICVIPSCCRPQNDCVFIATDTLSDTLGISLKSYFIKIKTNGDMYLVNSEDYGLHGSPIVTTAIRY